MKNKIYVLLIMFLTVYSVSAANLANYDINGYSFEYSGDRWKSNEHMEFLTYTNSDEVDFSVITISSENSGDIDWLLYDRIRNSPNTLKFGEYSVYLSEDGKYVFWRSGNSLIQIHSNPENIYDFPENLIQEYLKLNPTTCKEDDCYESVAPQPEEDYTFKDPKGVEPRVRDYTQKNIPCPGLNSNEDKIKSKIQESLHDANRFNENQIISMDNDCKEGKEAFTISLKAKTPFMNVCVGKIESGLAQRNITNYKDFDVVTECVIQEEFRERYSSEINLPNKKSFFDELLEKRVTSAINEIELKGANHKRTENDDEGFYNQKQQQEINQKNPTSFDSSSEYTVETFPEYDEESAENFLSRFLNYFKRAFDVFEWQQSKEEKKNSN